MKTIIAGSRDITDIKKVMTAIEYAAELMNIEVTEVVSGTARGVDQLGEEIGAMFGVPVQQFPADWNAHGKSAGYKRNADMAKYAEALIAVWDGSSKGTKHMIDLAQKEKLSIYIHRTDNG